MESIKLNLEEIPLLQFRDRSHLLDLIKSCGKEKDLCKTTMIHADIVSKRDFIRRDVYIGIALIRTYAKCGSLEKAKEVFEQIPIRNVRAWNALIVGYSQHRRGHEALRFFERMQDEGIAPDAVTYVCALKACGIVKNLKLGEDIEAQIRRKRLLEKDIVLGNTLVDMYAKCGSLKRARKVFDQLLMRDVVSWNALISGYSHHGFGDEALKCFTQMQDEGIPPDIVTYICSLKACAIMRSLGIGEYIANEVRDKGLLQKDIMLGTALVDMFAKCGALVKAREVFEEFRKMRNVSSWNAMITGYAQHGFGFEALNCFKQMKSEGISPNAITYICILKACGLVGSLDMGEVVASEVREKSMWQNNIMLGTALVDMYAKYGALEKAQEVFEQLPARNVVSWNALIAGYVQHGLSDEALQCFRKMQDEGIPPSSVTYICISKACGVVGSLEIGEIIDADVRKQGLLQNDVVLGTALLDMYGKCGELVKAREVFDFLAIKDVVAWTALISGYAQHGFSDEALKCFRQMQDEGLSPHAVTFISILRVCVTERSFKIVDAINAEVRKEGLLQRDVMLGNTLVDTYAKSGAFDKAREVFEHLPVRDVVSWTALIAGYTEFKLGDEALKCFGQMREEGVSPDAMTYNCVLKACGIIGSLQIGEDIDAEVRRRGLLHKDLVLGNTLVDMYAKCGAIEKSREVFDQLEVQDIVSWTALMAGYAQLGEAQAVLGLFNKMKAKGVMPTLVTFLVSLTACSHAGFLLEGEQLFDDMCVVYGLSPTLDHYTCMIDLLGRAGHLDKAKVLLDKVQSSDHLPLLLAIMSACYKWVNLELGRWAFEQSLQLDENCASAFVCMKNIYAAVGMLTEANENCGLTR